MWKPALAALALGACATGAPVEPSTSPAAPANARRTLDLVYGHLIDADPSLGVSLGLHDHDGELPDRSPEALASEATILRADRAALGALHDGDLPPLVRDERDLLASEIAGRLFHLTELDDFHTNPMVYTDAIDLDSYIVRDYAPIATRAAAAMKLCDALPAYLAQARANLTAPIPRPWLDTALLQFRGLRDLADHEIRDELAAAHDPALGPALDRCKATLADHVAWLEQQQPRATDQFALGPDRFIRMLATTQGIDLDLPTLQHVVDADLARNTTALEAAAHQIAPGAAVADTVRKAGEDRPTADQVLAVATAQATALRQYILDHHLITIPTNDPIDVRLSPPFQRWNAAFLDAPGPFETRSLPSHYYISPPDPSWPADEQRTYIPPRADLLFTTAHEVYPGHFVHALHVRKVPSKILQSFCTYTMQEGWAHYVEEMMYDAGAAGPTPQAHIGQLKEALLRDVRFEVTLGEHTGHMSVADATALFATRGFVDPGNARQQAVRGTFDPMYLAYTLGKLIIRKLRDDWMARHPGATLAAFHDELLSHACLPLPIIRRDMLGPSAGPVL